ncbi:MAG: AAA family ATPase, partial [Roseiflexaceae bacterium]
MYLKRLEIQGFKTFASKTLFEFRPGVSAIIGPNGSGKSNVVDAIRWVLGEQSYSMLRSRKADDLIFGGGPRRAPAGFAEVSLTIDNSDRTLPLAYDTVTITRRSTRSGDHEYFINKAKVRLRDIQEATAALGGSYTIINQGLVDNVLDLRPEERRRLFEDAADISVHEQRRNDAMRRLRETDANVRRCDDVITELEPRLRSLRRQAGAAKQYRDLKHELDTVQIRLLRLQHQQALHQLQQAQQADQ